MGVTLQDAFGQPQQTSTASYRIFLIMAACVERVEANSMRTSVCQGIYPSPSSSPESPQATISSAAPTRRNVERPSQAVAFGLHTPKSSLDDTKSANGNNKGPRVLDQHVKDIEEQIRIHSASAVLDSLTLNIAPEVWSAVEEKVSEDRRAKCTYDRESGVLIVTCPTAVHETVSAVVRPFRAIADAKSTSKFFFDTNRELTVSRTGGANANETPDFAFGKKPAGPTADREPGIIVECGYSQSSASLQLKAERWFTVPSVKCVISIKFKSKDFAMPPASVSPPQKPVDRAVFASASAGLDDVMFENHNWAPAIEKITVSIYLREDDDSISDGGKMDITPGAEDLVRSQEAIVETMYWTLRRFMGDAEFSALYTNQQAFSIDWPAFYNDIELAQLEDAFRRYLKWVGKTPDHYKPQPTASTFLRSTDIAKRSRELYERTNGADGDTTAQASVPKKQKKSCRTTVKNIL
ncbi:hypothetical protein FB451DRAFT_1259282 [Mycena latifolia]|nr:hypothetical protein FB451DRAFT_1259282 [Mycena latifolia]